MGVAKQLFCAFSISLFFSFLNTLHITSNAPDNISFVLNLIKSFSAISKNSERRQFRKEE
jgi:hypothetical protein